jgi:calcium/calmodulin-dependent protein kinase (CaM kinase) II
MDIGADAASFGGAARELIDLTVEILRCMYEKDSARYAQLVADDVSSVEPYIAPYRVDGIGFHLSLIAAGGNALPVRLDLLTPRVQIYDSCGIVSYTLLKTFATAGHSEFSTINETRVFARIGGAWKMVHLHKSPTKAG